MLNSSLHFGKPYFMVWELKFSLALHITKTNEKIEQVNQVLEDMLRMYAMQQPSGKSTFT